MDKLKVHFDKETSDRLTTGLFLILTVMVCGAYAAIHFNRTMPFAECWYTYYSKLINGGSVVYRDFDYLFTPLYIYFIALVTKIFGYKLIVLRVLGVFLFCGIGCIIFLILKEMFRDAIAFISTVCAVFYMQSEVVQTFYDYVRVMDLFSACTVLFLLKGTKALLIHDLPEKKKDPFLYFLFAGLFNSLFLLTKQNMGLLFFVFSLILIFAVHAVLKNRKPLRTLAGFMVGFFVPVLITVALMAASGSLTAFFQQSGSDALAAKGGVTAILFGWFGNNAGAFSSSLPTACLLLIIIIVFSLMAKILPSEPELKEERVDMLAALAFFAALMVCIRLFCRIREWAVAYAPSGYFSPYTVFLVIVPFFLYYVVHVVAVSVRKTVVPSLYASVMQRELPYIVITGSYIAIIWGCGMSGGVSEGQSTLGVGFLCALLLGRLTFRYSLPVKAIITIVLCMFTLQSADRKMLYTYNWWGMTEADVWDCKYKSEDISLLKGIRLSEEVLNAYETIYHTITENTSPEDAIYCFPQIPSFYALCDRSDPGVRAVVQWFDVAADTSIENDMQVLTDNPPAAVLIFETSEGAYNAHENTFRGGDISATRKMKRFLLNFVQDNGYDFKGRIFGAGDNSLLLYIKPEKAVTHKGFRGQGTKENPYLISFPQDLELLSSRVKNGNDYAGQYFCQTCDLDMSSITKWTPIGEFNSGGCFRGIYDGCGYEIRNLSCISKENIGIFGQLGGVVCNLGVVDCNFSGYYVGVISSRSFDEGAAIINCYTNSTITGYRAGGIADNFTGSIINCVSVGVTNGVYSANAVSFTNGNIKNVYSSASANYPGIVNSPYENKNVVQFNKSYLDSGELEDSLNDGFKYFSKELSNPRSLISKTGTSRWLTELTLQKWSISKQAIRFVNPTVEDR